MDHKYVRDVNNPGVVMNTDTDALTAYKKRRELLRHKDVRIETLESRLNSLEQLIAKLVTDKTQCQSATPM